MSFSGRLLRDQEINDEKSKKNEKKGLQHEKDNQREKKTKKGYKEKINWSTEKKNIREFLSQEYKLEAETINQIINNKDEKQFDIKKFNDFKNRKVIDKNVKILNSKIKLSNNKDKKSASTSIKGKTKKLYNTK